MLFWKLVFIFMYWKSIKTETGGSENMQNKAKNGLKFEWLLFNEETCTICIKSAFLEKIT